MREERARLAAGPMVALILDNMAQVRSSRETARRLIESCFNLQFTGAAPAANAARLRSHSAHDDTVGPLLAALGQWSNQSEFKWPAYAANVVVELWRNKPAAQSTGGSATTPDAAAASPSASNFSVRVLLDGQPLPLLACNGAIVCDLEQFRDFNLRRMVPQDMLAECKPK